MRLGLVVGSALGALGALSSGVAAAPRPGKVVRIERARAAPGSPRFCIVSNDGTGRCVGKPPSIGDHVDVLDSTRPLAVLRITSVMAAKDPCDQAAVWEILSSVDSGDLAALRAESVGVLDVPIDRRVAHLIDVDKAPSGRSGDQVFAIDEDGDGSPDLQFASFPCDDGGNPSPNPTGTCSDVWTRTPHGFERVRQDRIRNCL